MGAIARIHSNLTQFTLKGAPFIICCSLFFVVLLDVFFCIFSWPLDEHEYDEDLYQVKVFLPQPVGDDVKIC